ncbi:unnamed protein product [Diabrotica balteata]|uniref:Uncharacterized protein n=1 Tax=Diabrotica balteata TaxID=107213 RepID=A0A9N9SMS1_DIABA|nr:unnamed protein product [Diabrotica balteata]
MEVEDIMCDQSILHPEVNVQFDSKAPYPVIPARHIDISVFFKIKLNFSKATQDNCMRLFISAIWFSLVFTEREKYNFLRLIMQEKVEGRRGSGRRKCFWLKNVRDWTGMDTHSILRTYQDREQFAVVIANLQ